MKRVLVPFFNAGFGHSSIAKAIAHEICRRHPDWEVRLQDPGNELPNQRLNKLYVENWKKILALPKFIKSIMFKLEPLLHGLSSRINEHYITEAAPFAADFIDEWHPDVIVSTHWGCGHLYYEARKLSRQKPSLHYVFTELGGKYRLTDCGADHYYALTDEARADLMSIGIAQENVHTVGLVVQPELESLAVSADDRKDPALRKAIADARISLGLEPDCFTILYSLGGEGIGNAIDFLQALYHSKLAVQVIVLTSKNRFLYDQVLFELPPLAGRPRILPFGFLPTLELPYLAADVFAGKCGTSFAMETVRLGKPLLVCQWGADNERINMDWLVKHGVGWDVTSPARFVSMVEKICQGSPEWHNALNSLEQADTSCGAAALVDHVLETLGASMDFKEIQGLRI